MNFVTMVTGLIAAAAVGALIVVAVSDEPAPVQAGPTDTSRLESQIETLQAGMSRLETKVAMLENEWSDPTYAAAPVGGVVRPETDDAPLAASTTLDDEALKEKVLEVVKEKETADRESRTERWAAVEATREKARLDLIEKELNLDAYQKEELGKILAERRAAMMKMRETMMAGEGRPDPAVFETMRTEFARVREESSVKIQNILSADQYEKFQAMDSTRGPGGRGGRGGGLGR